MSEQQRIQFYLVNLAPELSRAADFAKDGNLSALALSFKRTEHALFRLFEHKISHSCLKELEMLLDGVFIKRIITSKDINVYFAPTISRFLASQL